MAKLKVQHPVTGKIMWVEEDQLSEVQATPRPVKPTPAPKAPQVRHPSKRTRNPGPNPKPEPRTISQHNDHDYDDDDDDKPRGDFLFDDGEIENL